MIPFLYNRPIPEAGVGNQVEHYVFDVYKYREIFSVVPDGVAYREPGSSRFNPHVLDMVKRRISPDREIIYVSHFGGNSHNALTMLSPSPGFDFFHPLAPEIEIDPERCLVPNEAVRRIIRQNCKIYLDDLSALVSDCGKSVYHVISPPPIKSDAVVEATIDNDPYFASLKNVSVTPANIRYKSWLTHSHIYAAVCDELGAGVLWPPEEAVAEGKWLSPDCIGSDPTHGNLRYGGLVFEKLEGTFGGYFAGWDWIR